MRAPFEIGEGAWWVVPDGRTIAVPSFHESWLAAHPAIAGDAKNTIEFVKKSGWLSVTLYSGGMVEIISRDQNDPRQRQAILQLLARNRPILSRAVIFVPAFDGCLTLGPELLDDSARIAEMLARFEQAVTAAGPQGSTAG